jgi:NAD dependent epimerase/dehydratase family enzyme
VVAPEPVTNREFTRTLGRLLHRPTIFAMPTVAARVAFGEMADELLLASQRVRPAKLVASGFTWQWPTAEGALRHVLQEAPVAPAEVSEKIAGDS